MRKNDTRKIGYISVNNDIQQVQSIEEEIRIASTSGQPLEAISPILYTDRKDGVLAEFNIRTDRWEIAQEAMGKVAKSYAAKRAEMIKARTPEPEGGAAAAE